MLIENMQMAFFAIRINKMRSILTMLGIIIGIGSVISIVSIGDTMRAMFADLYKNVGLTQAYVSIGYWVNDTRQGDYFNLDEMEQVKEALDRETAEWEEKERMNAGPDPEPSGQGLEMQQQKRGMRK